MKLFERMSILVNDRHKRRFMTKNAKSNPPHKMHVHEHKSSASLYILQQFLFLAIGKPNSAQKSKTGCAIPMRTMPLLQPQFFRMPPFIKLKFVITSNKQTFPILVKTDTPRSLSLWSIPTLEAAPRQTSTIWSPQRSSSYVLPYLLPCVARASLSRRHVQYYLISLS